MQSCSPIGCLPDPAQSLKPYTGPSCYTDAFPIHRGLWCQGQAIPLCWPLSSPCAGSDVPCWVSPLFSGFDCLCWVIIPCMDTLFTLLVLQTPDGPTSHVEASLFILQRLTPLPRGKPSLVSDSALEHSCSLSLAQIPALLIPLNGFWAELLGKGKETGKKSSVTVFHIYQL